MKTSNALKVLQNNVSDSEAIRWMDILHEK